MQLALDTSTNICSVAFRDEKGRVHEKRTEVRGSHSEQLFLFIDELKKEHGFEVADLESVIVSEGPGSYTGLRISASAVKGLLFQQQTPLLAANTLASFAASVAVQNEIETIHSIIDARRVHVYHQQFEIAEDKLKALTEVKVRPIDDLGQMLQDGDVIVGTGINRLDEEIVAKAKAFGASHISAKSLFNLHDMDEADEFVKAVDVESFDPKYYSSNQV